MIGRWGLYGDLMRELRRAGFTPDDADRAARVAERAVTERRDAMIRVARASGMGMSRIGGLWGLTRQHIHRICRASHDARPNATTIAPKLQTQDQQQRRHGGPAAEVDPQSTSSRASESGASKNQRP